MKLSPSRLNKTSQGMSMMEMILVISITGIISAVALPSLGSLLGGSNLAKTRGNAETVNRLLKAADSAGAIGIPPWEPSVNDIIKAITTQAIYVDLDGDNTRDAAERMFTVNADLSDLLSPSQGLSIKVSRTKYGVLQLVVNEDTSS